MQDEDIGAWSAEYISRTIGAVTRLTGLSVCLYDLNRLRAGVKNVDWRHESAFCTAVRMLPEGRAACIQSDVIEGVAQAEREGRACLHTCHAGLCELVVPIMLDERMIGEAFIGQCRLKGGLGWPSVVRQGRRDAEGALFRAARGRAERSVGRGRAAGQFVPLSGQQAGRERALQLLRRLRADARRARAQVYRRSLQPAHRRGRRGAGAAHHCGASDAAVSARRRGERDRLYHAPPHRARVRISQVVRNFDRQSGRQRGLSRSELLFAPVPRHDGAQPQRLSEKISAKRHNGG